MGAVAQLTEQPIQADRLLADFIADAEGAGAVVSFCGLARARGKSGAIVERLELHHHPRMTAESLDRIVADGLGRFDVTDVLVAHRFGSIVPGEIIVFVAAASPHRRAAFLAADYLMDRLKTGAVFWKKEKGLDADNWIEPSEADCADVARWGE